MAQNRIEVRKSERKMLLFTADGQTAAFAIALGKEPVGHKQREGDKRTPEGTYYVCIRNENSRFYRSLVLNYPSKADADAALKQGSITPGEHAEICLAALEGRRPPFTTLLGGEICIHGGGSERDWTAGCIAVEDAVMDVLFLHCPLGTPVTILP